MQKSFIDSFHEDIVELVYFFWTRRLTVPGSSRAASHTNLFDSSTGNQKIM